MLFCIDCTHCTHYKLNYSASTEIECARDIVKQSRLNLVTGETNIVITGEYYNCEAERAFDKGCGKQGKYFNSASLVRAYTVCS